MDKRDVKMAFFVSSLLTKNNQCFLLSFVSKLSLSFQMCLFPESYNVLLIYLINKFLTYEHVNQRLKDLFRGN